jgi:hypothetical protein
MFCSTKQKNWVKKNLQVIYAAFVVYPCFFFIHSSFFLLSFSLSLFISVCSSFQYISDTVTVKTEF